MKINGFSILFIVCCCRLTSSSIDHVEDCNMEEMAKMTLYYLLQKSIENEGLCLSQTRHIFTKKYNDTVFKITGPFNDDEDNAISEDDLRTSAYIRNFNVIRDFLESFGNLMHNIEIDLKRIDAGPAKDTIKDINSKCYASLTDLKLENCKGSSLDDLTYIFSNVTTFHFSSSSPQKLVVKDEADKFEKIFPKVSRLSIGYTRASDWELIGEVYPYLKDFSVDLPKSIVEELPSETCVQNIIDKSPKIERLSIKHSSLNLLNEINTKLPNLNSIDLRLMSKDYFNSSVGKIHFEEVRYLSVKQDCHGDEIPERIAFPKVQEVSLRVQPEITEKWISFMSDQLNRNINRLEIITSILSDKNFHQIPERLNSLTSVFICCGTELTAIDIALFLQKARSLKSMIIKIPMETAEQIILKAEVQKNWKCDIHPSTNNKVMITLARLSGQNGRATSQFANYSAQSLVISVFFVIMRLI